MVLNPGSSSTEVARPAAPHGFHAEEKNGAAPRNLAPDAYDCIMVKVERTCRIQDCGGSFPHPRRVPLRSFRSATGLSTGCRCLIPGHRSAPACGQTQTVDPSNKGAGHLTFPLDNKSPIQGAD